MTTRKEKISTRPKIMRKLQYSLVHAGRMETSATPKRSIVDPTLDRQPTAIPMACMGVTPDREMISMETKNVAMKRKK